VSDIFVMFSFKVLIEFFFLIDIINNIINTSVSHDQNFHQWQCRIIVKWERLRHVTMILHCHWYEFWSCNTDVLITLSIISIQNEKLVNSNNNRSRPKFSRLLWDIFVFRLVAYLLNIICLNLRFLYDILHIYEFCYNFDTFLYKCLETRTSYRTLICLDQLLRFSSFSLYPPSFFLYSPLITKGRR